VKYKLIELIKIKNGKDYKSCKMGDIPVYGTGGIISYINEFLSNDESILLPRKGSLSNIIYVNQPFWTVDTMYWTYVNKEIILPKYLYFYLKLLDLSSRDSGSTLPSMTFDAYYELEVEIPNIKEQKKILDLLNPIEEKIMINNKINDNLEKQLVFYYTYYFLQNNTSTEKISLDKVADLYQPETISIKQLDDNLDYFVFGANGIIGKYHKYNHENYQIVIACRGANCGITLMTLPKSWITGNAMVVKPKEYFPYKEFLYQTLKLKSPSYLTSGSAQPQITRENLSLYEIDINDKKKLDKFENFASRIRKNIISNKLENISLIKLREFLLPILMNGQATISE